MPEYPDTITQAQYDQYTSDWAALIETGNDDALRPAFQAPNGERFTFLTFSLDQIVALVTTPGARSIKARFLLMPDNTGAPRFSLALFASDEAPDNAAQYLSAFYIPTPAQATSTRRVERSAGPDTSVPADEAKQWLNTWVQNELTTELFNTDSGPLKGCNFTVSTFQDPLAAAWPYTDRTLFVNLGLIYDPELTSVLAVYIGAIGSRQQGSTAGLPDSGYYDQGLLCPPNH